VVPAEIDPSELKSVPSATAGVAKEAESVIPASSSGAGVAVTVGVGPHPGLTSLTAFAQAAWADVDIPATIIPAPHAAEISAAPVCERNRK
jgi:hypothetical protein